MGFVGRGTDWDLALVRVTRIASLLKPLGASGQFLNSKSIHIAVRPGGSAMFRGRLWRQPEVNPVMRRPQPGPDLSSLAAAGKNAFMSFRIATFNVENLMN